ncbi:MAG: 3-dehydroquinate synthase [Bacteroidota bacterium]
MQQLNLANYSIFIGHIFPALEAFLAQKNYARIVLIDDENTHRHCLPILEKHIDSSDFLIITVPEGELNKNIQTTQLIWKTMMDNGVGRRDLCINLGGGVIGDMGGFAASTYKRGIDFIQIPTTLLSQVDASIGGKLGIDFNEVKNSVGVFEDPKAVFVDPIFHATLPKGELRSGFAEIVKHSLIDNPTQWERIRQIDDLASVAWVDFLTPSLKIKQRIVEIDPFEAGLRKALNFGHTIGHAIESDLLETADRLLHGEAIAIGMICESYIAHKVSGLSVSQLQEITDFFVKIYGKINLDRISYPKLIHLMRKDKKNEKDEINFTLLEFPGKAIINQTCSEALIIESLDYYRNIKVENVVMS